MTDNRSNRTALRYAIKTAQRPGVTRDLPYGPDDLLWVANSSTLVYGSNDAVLVPSLSTSGETLTIEESMTLRARTENAGHGDEYEWSPGGG